MQRYKEAGLRKWLIALLLPNLVLAQSTLDPIDLMCSRWLHQSTLYNGTLYVNGGVQTFRTSTNASTNYYGYNSQLITVDMRQSWDWKTNITEIATAKAANTRTGTLPPSLVRGASYQGTKDDPRIWLYGGSTSQANNSFQGYQAPSSATYNLWSYDTSSKAWEQYDMSLHAPERPNHGAVAEAPDLNLAFYLNGQVDLGTSSKLSLTNMGNSTINLPGMIVMNLTEQDVRNLSTTALNSGYPAVGGHLTYLPDVGSKGILLSLGGQYNPDHTDSSFTNNTSGALITYDHVSVFDVDSILGNNTNSNGIWYTQNTTGAVPPPRTDGCILVASAPDNSSHNVYLYAGRDNTMQPPKNYDDLYVLSIPSFAWIKVYEGTAPRYGHTCHNVGPSPVLQQNRQMLTVNGVANVSKCDWETKGVAILDMSTMTWGSVFDANARTYEVPKQVYQVIGGGAEGGATVRQPVNTTWNGDNVRTLFNTKRNWNSTLTPVSTASKRHHPSTANIAGIAIGAVAGLLAALFILLMLYRRRSRRLRVQETVQRHERSEEELDSSSTQKHELSDKDVERYLTSAELHDTSSPIELHREGVFYGAELPGDCFAPGGRAGVPRSHVDEDEKAAIREVVAEIKAEDEELDDAIKAERIVNSGKIRVENKWIQVFPGQAQDGAHDACGEGHCTDQNREVPVVDGDEGDVAVKNVEPTNSITEDTKRIGCNRTKHVDTRND